MAQPGSDSSWPELIRSLRDKRKLSRNAVAEAAQLSAAAVKAYESGRRRPKLSTAGRLLQSLDASEHEILMIAEAFGYHPRAVLRTMSERT